MTALTHNILRSQRTVHSVSKSRTSHKKESWSWGGDRPGWRPQSWSHTTRLKARTKSSICGGWRNEGRLLSTSSRMGAAIRIFCLKKVFRCEMGRFDLLEVG